MTRGPTGPIVLDVGVDHSGPFDVEIRRHGRILARLTIEPGLFAPDQTEPPLRSPCGPGMDSVAVERRERERQILDAAADVIADKGLAATSMRDIARAAGISIAAMYRHIGSKDELLSRITTSRMGTLFEHFETNLRRGGTPAERLAEAVAVYLDYISENHRYINLVYRETKALNDTARNQIFDTERQFTQLWEEIIRDGVEAGDFVVDDVNLAANIAYFACTAWALRYWSIGDRAQTEVAALLTQLLVGGLRRAPG